LILEIATLDIRPGMASHFELAFLKAEPIISSMQGYISHELQRCIENCNRYVLLVYWETLEAHTLGFRRSPQYEDWKRLLHHFYEPFPRVEHFELILGSSLPSEICPDS
jgi:heme-degrading monooxygenase HmoA